MRQLPLNVRLSDHAVFASYFAGEHAAAVASLQAAAAAQGPRLLWVWGGRASGRTHLLQAAVAAAPATADGAVYLPLRELATASPELLDGLDELSFIALDDIEAVAGNGAWERALLLLHDRLSTASGRMAISATRPPAQAGIALPDLASRCSTAAVFHLAPLSDRGCAAALQQRAAWRGLTLPDEVAQYLLTRMDRDIGSLFAQLDRLDHAALAAQRRLTVPFARSVLETAR